MRKGSRSIFIEELKRVTPLGQCIICLEPSKSKCAGSVCRKPVCRRARMRLLERGWRLPVSYTLDAPLDPVYLRAPVKSKSPMLEELKAETPPGVCLGCDERLPPPTGRRGRPRILCGDAECRKIWLRVWAQGRRLAEKEARDG